MKTFLLIFLICSLQILNAQDFVFTKTFPLDSSFGGPFLKILLTSDNNILIAGSYQNDLYSGSCKIITMKVNQIGNIIWQKNIQRPGVTTLTDVFEKDGKYYLVSNAEIYIGKYIENILTLSAYDNDGNLLNDNLDTSKKSNPYHPSVAMKYKNGLVSLSTIYNSNVGNILGWLDYDLEGNFQNRTIIDTLNFPNLNSIFNMQISILNDETVGYSFGTSFKDNTAPIWYNDYDSTKKITKKFSLNATEQNMTPSYAGPIFKTQSGHYILTGRINNYNLGMFSFVRMIDTSGKMIWEDSLKGSYWFNKIVEDSEGNILVAGSKYNKTDTDQVHIFNYFNLVGFRQNGAKLFNLIWGDSTKTHYLNDIISKDNGHCFVAGGDNYLPYLAEITYQPNDVNDNSKSLNDSGFIIAPNPTFDFLYIKSNNTIGKVEIFSSLGIKVLSTEYKDRIDVNGLSAGVYFVIVDNKFLKFIKI
jgi:hypothetical protein